MFGISNVRIGFPVFGPNILKGIPMPKVINKDLFLREIAVQTK